MKYANWEDINEMKNVLKKISPNEKIEKSGIIMMAEEDNLYIDDKGVHTLVIGSTGSGKTQTTILPTMKLALKAEESVVVHDVAGELYQRCAKNFEDNGYEVILIDLADSIYGNYWNPFILPYQLYKSKYQNRAIQYVENIAYYIVRQEKYMPSADPFWENSAIDLFTGIALHLFNTDNTENITIKNVCNAITKLEDNEYCTNFMNNLDKNSTVYTYLCGSLLSAEDTRRSILAVLLQKLKPLTVHSNLVDMTSKSDFDITQISNKKTAVFITTGNNQNSTHLTPLFIDQVIASIELFGNKEKRINILLDDFDNLIPIQNFAKIINYSRSLNIRLTVLIKSFTELINMYGKEDSEIIKLCFANIIYLLSNDYYTLEEISKLCGKENNDTPLISIEELKIMKPFEAIIIMHRHLPFKTSLTPDYKINWELERITKELPERI